MKENKTYQSFKKSLNKTNKDAYSNIQKALIYLIVVDGVH